MSLFHYIAEIECDILGHIPSRTPVVVYHKYRGDVEKVADNLCENCGHHIVNGLTRVRRMK